MFEKIGDFFKKQFRNAFHAVTKSFTLFFPLVLSVLLIECMFFSVILAFDNNMKLQTEAVESTYDHHLVLSGLDNVETAFVGRHAARSESSTGNFIIKHNVGGTLYIKLLTGNKANAAFFDSDTLKSNYDAMRRDLYGVLDIEEHASFTPLYDLESDLSSMRTTRNLVLLLFGALLVILFISFYSIYLNNQKYIYGLYAAFGGRTLHLCLNALFEIFICATFTLLPAYYASSLLCYSIYSSNGIPYDFSLLPIGTWIVMLLFMIPFLAIGVSFPIKRISFAEPLLLIDAQDNTNLVTSPRTSFNMLRRSFPFGYEVVSAWRFRKHHVLLATTSALLCSIFVMGFFSAVLYKQNTEITQKTSHDFTVQFFSVDVLPDEYPQYYSTVNGVKTAYKGFDSTDASELAALLLIDDAMVKENAGLAYDELEKIYYTGKSKIMGVTGADAIDYLKNTYTITGNPNDLFSDPQNVIIGSSFMSSGAFSYAVGDEITLAIPREDEDGDILLKEDVEPIENATGDELWHQQYQKILYDYETFRVVAVIDDYPSAAEGVPLVFNGDTYEEITQKEISANTLYIKAEDSLTLDEFIALETRLNTEAHRHSNDNNYLVTTLPTYFDGKMQDHFCYEDLIRALICIVLCFVPVNWFYSQWLFFKRRSAEFYSLHSISASLERIRSIFLCDCLLMLPIGLLSALISLGFSLLAQWIFTYVLPNVFQMSGIVTFSVDIPVWVYLICMLLSFISCILSAFFPYLSYKRRYWKSFISETLEEKDTVLERNRD